MVAKLKWLFVAVLNWLENNWERTLFGGLGLIFFVFSINYLWSNSLAASSAAFGMGFLCFIFDSLSRFKKFKGLGFEAELWEDKQKEAAALIDRLKGIVAIYSREVITSRVTSSRWGGDPGGWKSHWKLFDELTGQHLALGQEIDFTDLKKTVDVYFVLDMVLPLLDVVRNKIADGRSMAQHAIEKKFGSPITDISGHHQQVEKLGQIGRQIKDPWSIAMTENLAKIVIEWAADAQTKLKEHFQVTVNFEPEVLSKLREVSDAYENAPIKVTERLISLADGEKS